MMSDERNKLKMAAISGASHAMKFKEQNPRATTEEVIRHVSENTEHILGKIESAED